MAVIRINSKFILLNYFSKENTIEEVATYKDLVEYYKYLKIIYRYSYQIFSSLSNAEIEEIALNNSDYFDIVKTFDEQGQEVPAFRRKKEIPEEIIKDSQKETLIVNESWGKPIDFAGTTLKATKNFFLTKEYYKHPLEDIKNRITHVNNNGSSQDIEEERFLSLLNEARRMILKEQSNYFYFDPNYVEHIEDNQPDGTIRHRGIYKRGTHETTVGIDNFAYEAISTELQRYVGNEVLEIIVPRAKNDISFHDMAEVQFSTENGDIYRLTIFFNEDSKDKSISELDIKFYSKKDINSYVKEIGLNLPSQIFPIIFDGLLEPTSEVSVVVDENDLESKIRLNDVFDTSKLDGFLKKKKSSKKSARVKSDRTKK